MFLKSCPNKTSISALGTFKPDVMGTSRDGLLHDSENSAVPLTNHCIAVVRTQDEYVDWRSVVSDNDAILWFILSVVEANDRRKRCGHNPHEHFHKMLIQYYLPPKSRESGCLMTMSLLTSRWEQIPIISFQSTISRRQKRIGSHELEEV